MRSGFHPLRLGGSPLGCRPILGKGADAFAESRLQPRERARERRGPGVGCSVNRAGNSVEPTALCARLARSEPSWRCASAIPSRILRTRCTQLLPPWDMARGCGVGWETHEEEFFAETVVTVQLRLSTTPANQPRTSHNRASRCCSIGACMLMATYSDPKLTKTTCSFPTRSFD